MKALSPIWSYVGLLSFFLLAGYRANAQPGNETDILISAGTTLQNAGTLIYITGDVINNGTIDSDSSSYYYFRRGGGGGGSGGLSGGAGQRTVMGQVGVNMGDGFHIDGNIEITELLQLINGRVVLDSGLLSLAPEAVITGASPQRYIVTTPEGALEQNVGTGSMQYPVGTSAAYTPVTLDNLANNGQFRAFSVKVLDSLYNTYDSTTGLGSGPPPVNADVVRRSWIVNGGDTAGVMLGVTVQWPVTAESATFDRTVSALRYFNYDSSAWVPASVVFTPASGTNPYGQTGSFSLIGPVHNVPIGVFSGVNPSTPIELIGFGAMAREDDAILSWSYSRNAGVKDFLVQRSEDGLHWTSISAIAAAGTSDYSYPDKEILLRTAERGLPQIYYRLIVRSISGSLSYSAVATVAVGEKKNSTMLTASPNPFNGVLKVQLFETGDKSLRYTLRSATGHVLFADVLVVQKGLNSFFLHTETLPAGLYLLEIDSGEKTHRIKLVKQ